MDFFPANFMMQTGLGSDYGEDRGHPHPSSLTQILPSCIPQDYHGRMATLLGKRSTMTAHSGTEASAYAAASNIGEEELSDDDGSQAAGEKKRRLSMEQVKILEKNFEMGSKLEAERKLQLARALGLQPRQIAIWFQNRRARWKTKQLEKDYDHLKRQLEAVMSDNEALRAHNHKLQAEIQALRRSAPLEESINLNKLETEGSSSNRSDNSSEFKLNISTRPLRAVDSPPQDTSLPLHTLTSRQHQLFPAASSSSLTSASRVGGITHQLHPGILSSRFDLAGKEENFANMFFGIDDQSGFWPWLEQHHFN
ncbi:hypothetical protein SAY87_016943 [Trapa incisa]|uniref:Homeobox-leucine zipper protein n=1 Tax=Trapa incisa TaxID=236973 RepID=A0AAN7L6V8_9MYRT|nr:hypothetical protein SAY87_016943 [Trapa incisa]